MRPMAPVASRARSLVVLAVGASLLGTSSCKSDPERGSARSKAARATSFVADPAASALAWLPPRGDGSRYRVDGTPRTYDKETVFELLNGGADALLDAGLVALLHVRLRDDAQISMDCEIQVMDVSSPDRSRALLRKEKAPEARREQLGDEGYSEPTGVLFAKGRHLVRVTALPAGSRKAAPVVEIARRIEATRGARF